MSSEDRRTRRKYLEARIAENRERLKEIFSKDAEKPRPSPRGWSSRGPTPSQAGVHDAIDPAASAAQGFADTLDQAQAEAAAATFPRSRTMRWAMDHPAEAAVAGVAAAALLGMGPVQLARWLRSSGSTRAGASFVRGVRDGVHVVQPLLPLLTAWLGHKWRSAERDEQRAARYHEDDGRTR
jgi:hypothetical protein